MQVQEPQEQWYDIYPQWHVPFWQTSFFFYTLCAVAVLSLGILLWMLWRWRSRIITIEPYPVVARKALDRLRNSPLYQQERASDFYNELVMVIKKYLSHCYDIDCISATDQECLMLLQSHVNHDELRAIVEQIFNGTVLVRFAQSNTGALQMMADDIEKAYLIIDLSQKQKMSAASLGA